MHRPLLAAVALAVAPLTAPAVAGAQREDPIPATVGPPLVHGFHVDPRVPAGVDAAAWLALAQRVLRRWGDPYLGTTTASATTGNDSLNVIGFSSLDGALGKATTSDRGIEETVARRDVCTPLPTTATNDTVRKTSTPVKVTLRRDLVRDGHRARRTVTRTVGRPRVELERAPLTATHCVTGPGLRRPRLTAREVDIEIADDVAWELGPAHPDGAHWDLESTLLHELGHTHGLAHQVDLCDVTTPMRWFINPASWWRGQDDAVWEDCPQNHQAVPDAPGVAAGTALPGGAEGVTVFANLAMPAGLDTARFEAVVRSVVVRSGAVYGGTTDALPNQPDGVGVIALSPVFGSSVTQASGHRLSAQVTTPAHRSCLQAGSTRATTRVAARRTVRRRSAGRLIRLRRDKLTKSTVSVPRFSCDNQGENLEITTAGRELDVAVNDRYAYQFGPSHPLLGTRHDLETAVLRGLLEAAGATRATDACATATPAAPLVPGDWWRGPDDISRALCARGDGVIVGRRRAGGVLREVVAVP